MTFQKDDSQAERIPSNQSREPTLHIPNWTFGHSVVARNVLQNCGLAHPYTCGNDRTDAPHRAYAAKNGGDFGQLVAVETGWLCPVCGYTQSSGY